MSVVAVFARTLRSGVTFDDYLAAWMPTGVLEYPADLDVGIDPSDDRRVITVLRFAGAIEEFRAKLPEMVSPSALDQLEMIVELTELNAVYETRPVEFA